MASILADNIFKCIFLTENAEILIKISLKFVPKGPINNIPALVQIMACRLPGDKPLSEPLMVRLSRHVRSHSLNELSKTMTNVGIRSDSELIKNTLILPSPLSYKVFIMSIIEKIVIVIHMLSFHHVVLRFDYIVMQIIHMQRAS